MKVNELFQATLSESAGDDMLKHAKDMKREGNLSGYHKQMVKYSEHMADAENFNARKHGKLSPQGKAAAARIKKFEKAAAEHKAAYRAEMDKSKGLNEAFSASTMKKGSGLGPQWSYRDLADKFGLSMQQLTSLRGKHPGFPDQSKDVKASKMSSNSHTYFDLKAATKWYNGVMKKVNGDIEELKKQLKK